MRKLILVFIVTFLFYACSSDTTDLKESNKTIFTWDVNPFDDGVGSVTETIDGLTVTVTAPLSEHTHSVGFFDIIDFDNVSDGNVVISFREESTITFTFNKPVTVVSIMALSGINKVIDYTFTPLDASKSGITKTLKPGTDVAFVSTTLNWDNITSFTVTSSAPTLFGFDFLTVIESSKLE